MVKPLLISLLIVSSRIRTSLSQNVFDCGVSQITTTELIDHGHNTVRGEWPWHVAIYQKHENRELYACGGTLLTKKHVLTAAHCLKNPEDGEPLLNEDVFIRLGVHQLNSTCREIQRRMISEIHRTDDFPRQDLRNDIAILKMAKEAKFGKYVQPACLSETEDLTGALGTVIGWGSDERDRVSAVLKRVHMPVIDFYSCLFSDKAYFGAMLDEGIFCAGHTNGTAVCNGDSGGGIFIDENGAWHLGGVLSFTKLHEDRSNSCYTKGYVAYTRIHTYIAWINAIVTV